MSEETERLLKEMSGKMDKILKLMVLNQIKENENEQEKIGLLESVGFRPIEIANLLGKSSDNVRVQLMLIRKKRKNSVKDSNKADSPENGPQTSIDQGEKEE